MRQVLVLLCLSIMSLSAQAESTLSFIFYSAPKRLNWTSPGALARSIAHNTFFELVPVRPMRPIQRGDELDNGIQYVNHPSVLSHVNVEINCANGVRQVYGMTGGREINWSALFQGSGLEIMLGAYRGEYVRKDEVDYWLPYLEKAGMVNRLTFRVSDENCQRAKRYGREYNNLGYSRVYGGLLHDPLQREGAGCAAFGMSFLKITDLYHSDFDLYFRRELRLPEVLMRTATHRPALTIWDYLFGGKDGHWATPDEKQLRIRFWDPQLMYDWVSWVYHGQVGFDAGPWTRAERQNSLEIIVDARHIPAPQGSYWLVAP